MVIGGIDYIGIDENLPNNIKYFREELVTTIFKKSKDNKDIHNIVSVSLDCNINSIKIINTQKRVSNEGQRLTGKKLLVEANLNYRIKYITNSKQQYIYILKPKINKVFYIVAPSEVDGIKIEDLLRQRKINIVPYIEDIYAQVRDENSIYIRTLLLLDLNFKKNYNSLKR